MAVTIEEVDAAIESVQTDGQSFSVDGQTYTKARLSELIALRESLGQDAGRSDGTRPTIRAVNFAGMGY